MVARNASSPADEITSPRTCCLLIPKLPCCFSLLIAHLADPGAETSAVPPEKICALYLIYLISFVAGLFYYICKRVLAFVYLNTWVLASYVLVGLLD